MTQSVGLITPVRVANTHDLAAQPSVPAPPGLWAFVEADGTYWSWYPTGTTPPGGTTTAAGLGGTWSLTVGVGGVDTPNAVIALATGNGPATSITTGNPVSITKAKSGKVMIDASLTVTATTGATVGSFQLLRDGTTLIGPVVKQVVAQTPTAGTYVGSAEIVFLETLPDSSAHTYDVQVTSTGGVNISCAANAGGVRAVEL